MAPQVKYCKVRIIDVPCIINQHAKHIFDFELNSIIKTITTNTKLSSRIIIIIIIVLIIIIYLYHKGNKLAKAKPRQKAYTKAKII